MILYGSVQKSNYTFGKWYLEIPEIWSRDKEYIKNNPYPFMSKDKQPDATTGLFDFYRLDIDWMDFNRVMDLRTDFWREKLLTFIKVFGSGWVSNKSIYDYGSPLEPLMYLGNYNILASKDYLWSVLKHANKETESSVELWYYVNTFEHPENFYELTKLDIEDFLNE